MGWSVWSGAGSGCSLYGPSGSAGEASTLAVPVAPLPMLLLLPTRPGVAVYDNGWTVYGGTSVSSPIIASVYALAEHPIRQIRRMLTVRTLGGLFDVTSGSNGSCTVAQWCTARRLGRPNRSRHAEWPDIVHGSE